MKKAYSIFFIALILLSTAFGTFTALIPTAEAATYNYTTVDQVDAKAAEIVKTAEDTVNNAYKRVVEVQKLLQSYNCDGWNTFGLTRNSLCDPTLQVLQSANVNFKRAQSSYAGAKTATDAAKVAARSGDFALANQKLSGGDAYNEIQAGEEKRNDSDAAAVDSKNYCIDYANSVVIPVIHIDNCVRIIAASIAYYALSLAGFVLGLCSLILDKILEYTVVNMKSNIDGLPSINVAWKIFRDLSNMAFIFILLYIAINTILGRNNGQIKSFLGKVIIIGLIINFSLFFTKVVIDASNIVTLGFYNIALSNANNVNNPYNTCEASAIASAVTCKGLSGKIMTTLGLASIYQGMSVGGLDANGNPKISSSLSGYDKIILIGLGGAIFSLVAAFTIITIAWLFIVRFVVLIVLMVLSPVAFIAWTVPGMQGTAKKWMDTLMGQAIFAPLYMAMFWVTFLLLDNIGSTLKGGQNLADTFSADNVTQNVGIVVNFLLVIIFLHVSAKFAKSYAVQGAGVVGKVGNWGANKVESVRNRVTRSVQTGAQVAAGAVTAGAAGAAYRSTVGRVSSNVLDKKQEDWNRKALTGNIVTRNIAKAQLAAANKLATSSGDVRNTEGGKDLGLGKGGGQGGYRGVVKAKADALEKDINRFGGFSQTTQADITKEKANIKEQEKAFRKATYGAANATNSTDKANYEKAKRQAAKSLRESYDKIKKSESKGEKEKKDQRIAYAQWLSDRRIGNAGGLVWSTHANKDAFNNVARRFSKGVSPDKDGEEAFNTSEFKDDIKEIVGDGKDGGLLTGDQVNRLKDILKKKEYNKGSFVTKLDKEVIRKIAPVLQRRHIEAIAKADDIDDDLKQKVAETVYKDSGHAAHDFVRAAKPDSALYTRFHREDEQKAAASNKPQTTPLAAARPKPAQTRPNPPKQQQAPKPAAAAPKPNPSSGPKSVPRSSNTEAYGTKEEDNTYDLNEPAKTAPTNPVQEPRRKFVVDETGTARVQSERNDNQPSNQDSGRRFVVGAGGETKIENPNAKPDTSYEINDNSSGPTKTS